MRSRAADFLFYFPSQTLHGEDLRVGRHTVFTHHTDTGRRSRTGPLWLSGRAPGKEEGWSRPTHMCHTQASRQFWDSGGWGGLPGKSGGAGYNPTFIECLLRAWQWAKSFTCTVTHEPPCELGRWLCDFPTLQGRPQRHRELCLSLGTQR